MKLMLYFKQGKIVSIHSFKSFIMLTMLMLYSYFFKNTPLSLLPWENASKYLLRLLALAQLSSSASFKAVTVSLFGLDQGSFSKRLRNYTPSAGPVLPSDVSFILGWRNIVQYIHNLLYIISL